MHSVRRQHRDPEEGAAVVLHLDERARRAGAILCALYLALVAIQLGHFLFTGFADLQRAVTIAEVARDTAVVAAGSEAATDPAASDAESALGDWERLAHRGWARVGGLALAILAFGWFLLIHRRRLRSRTHVVNALTLLVLVTGAILLASRLALQLALPPCTPWGLADVVVMHVLACAIVPWTVKESALPFAVLLGVWAVTMLPPAGHETEFIDRVVGMIISPLVLLPGAGIAAWRARRRHEDAERLMLGRRVETMGGELSRARIVHDAMFPPRLAGHVSFEYEYQPIQEIGGDYVHLHVDDATGSVMVTLLDVAGHGLAAALTVNRLFGELERVLAENAEADPQEVMTLLNRYICLTMAPHSMFATGTCMKLDPATGRFEWVSAGHPPALVRRSAGDVEELPTTAMLLGVLDPAQFDPAQRRTVLRPGDVLIAYTDGAFEARDAQGRQFGIPAIREIACFTPPPRDWPRFIANAIANHHAGNAEDDVLIVALTLRSLRIDNRPERDDRTSAATPLRA